MSDKITHFRHDEAASPSQQEPSPREREFCEWMLQFNSDPKFVQEFTTRFINACNERVLKGGYPTHFFSPQENREKETEL